MSKNTKDVIIKVFKAPEDPEKKKEWAHRMMRIQVAMWVDGKTCCELCGHIYSSVDDFLRCNPRRGLDKPDELTFVCSGCWNEYESKFKKTETNNE